LNISLKASLWTGDVYLQNNKALTLIDLDNDNRAVKNIGGGIIRTNDALNIANNIHQSSDFEIVSDGAMNIAADIQHQLGGTLTLQASGKITQTSGDIVSGSGTIHINTAGMEQTDGLMKSSNLILTSTDSVALSSRQNDLEILKADVSQGDFSYTDINDIAIDSITAQGRISITSQTQSILDSGDDQSVDLTAGGEIFLHAQRNIAGTENGDSFLELTENSTVTAISSGMGNIYLRTSGDIT